jgi:CBS domain-containing protein
MRAIDPVTFLRSIPPFDRISQPLFDGAARSLEVGFHATGTPLVRAGGEPLRHLYVIRKGAVRLERDGQTLDVLEEGEVFGYTSLITGKATLDATVEEDLLAYRLPRAEFDGLLADAAFAAHFAVGLADRLRTSLERSPVATFQADLSQEVGGLVRRAAVWIAGDATVADAAEVMRAEGISSVLVRGDPPGIVTDRDFRTRVLAEGRGPDAPLREVTSRPVYTVVAATPVHEAWKALLDAGVHHLAVERDGAIVGVLSSSDLLRCSAQGPVSVLRSVERLAGRESLPGYARRVAEMASALLAGGLDADTIGGFVARLNDALVRRILAWAEAALGPAPAPFAWLVFGSEGRMEQTLVTDQDNALAYADAGEPHRSWYRALAERVNDDLELAGFPRCAGGRMARRWHQSASAWADEIGACVDERPHAAGIFLDYRAVGGTLDASALDGALARARRHRLFVRQLAKSALDLSPPGTLLLRQSSRVDLKREGISPVVYLARCYAIEVGTSARNTLERLDAALAGGLMGENVHAEVTEAYRFLRGLLLRAQLRAISDHRPVGSEVVLADLSPLERNRLKASFRAIRGWQEKAAYHYQTALL